MGILENKSHFPRLNLSYNLTIIKKLFLLINTKHCIKFHLQFSKYLASLLKRLHYILKIYFKTHGGQMMTKIDGIKVIFFKHRSHENNI